MAANLTTIAISTRRVVRYGIFFVIFLTIARGVLAVGVNIYNAVVPKPPPAPTVRFGKLPSIPFPAPTQDLPTFNYTVETTTGSLPAFPTQVRVYLMPPYTSTLFSADDAKKNAAALGFTATPLELSPVLYRYASQKVPSILEMNIVNGSFSISYNLAADSSPLSGLPPAPEVAAVQAKDLLAQSGVNVTDLTGPSKHEFLKVEGQNLVRALSLSDSNLIRINLFRKDMDTGLVLEPKVLPSVTLDPNRSNAWMILSGARDKERQLVAAQVRHFKIDEKRFETYPIKTAAVALEELKNGKGYIANLGLNKDGAVTIRRIYLAYFDPDNSSSLYYQPVIVFEGDREFFAYVPAVTSTYYGE
jgi:hypothetical protein